MKKVIATILILSLTLPLCACGASASEPTPEPTPNPAEVLYEKYAGIIDALEAEDYDGAIAQISEMKPAPEIIEVTITPENILDYFDFEEGSDVLERDAEGNITSFWKSWSYGFRLKKEYQDKVLSDQSRALEVGITGHYTFRHVESMDMKTGERVLSVETNDELFEQFKKNYAQAHPEEGTELSASNSSTNIVYLSISGSAINQVWAKDNTWYGGWKSMFNFPADNGIDMFQVVLKDFEIVRADGLLVYQNEP